MAKKKSVEEVVVNNTDELLHLAQQLGGLNEMLRAKTEEYQNIQKRRDSIQAKLNELKKKK
jgi:hypothetical protein